MRTSFSWIFFGAALAISAPASADEVYVRVVDTGAGLCTVTRAPGGGYMVYDAGHWTGSQCVDAVREIVGASEIDLFVISHGDADHLGQAKQILEEFTVRQIIRTGFPRSDSASWRKMNDAMAEEARSGASIINLQTSTLAPGAEFPLGDANVTFVAGWPKWTGDGPTDSERRNAISIVVRLSYKGKSVLFTGDTVGRRKSDPDSACKDAEKAMVDNAVNVRLKSDVIIAPHHGGNNGNAKCFIEAVDPTFVIFSAGHSYEHPTAAAAGRYLAHGIQPQNIFRTDRGDDEGGYEWSAGRISGCKDGQGDDDVEITLPESGAVKVSYRMPSSGC